MCFIVLLIFGCVLHSSYRVADSSLCIAFILSLCAYFIVHCMGLVFCWYLIVHCMGFIVLLVFDCVLHGFRCFVDI